MTITPAELRKLLVFVDGRHARATIEAAADRIEELERELAAARADAFEEAASVAESTQLVFHGYTYMGNAKAAAERIRELAAKEKTK